MDGTVEAFRAGVADSVLAEVQQPFLMAPEYLEGSYNYKCDLWSCGVIMYILLAGHPPFEGKDFKDLKEVIKEAKVSFEGKEWEEISKDAKNLISSLLRKDSNKRITAEEAWNGSWIKRVTKNKKQFVSSFKGKLNLSNFQCFANKQKLQKAIYSFILHQVSTTDSMKEFLAIFKSFDKNGDGKLSYAELKEGFKKYYGENVGDTELDFCFKGIDLDKDKYIQYEEFLLASNHMNSLMTHQNLKTAFDCFDIDCSGKITPEEIKQVLKIDMNDENSEKNLILSMIKEFDKNGDGMISFEEFKEMMMKVVQK